MDSQLSLEKSTQFIESKFVDEVLPTLCKYIEIPNLSINFDKEIHTNGYQEQAVKLLQSWVDAQNISGCTTEILHETGLTPLLYIEIQGDYQDTLLMYGHFDKQPHMDGWEAGLGPVTPVIKDGLLYGRGGADDGYAVFSSVLAISNLKQQDQKTPRTIIIVEGSEESGSPDLPFYLNKIKDRLGEVKMMICLDAGCGDYERFWLSSSLRGVAMVDVHIKALKDGLHSGQVGGIVPDVFSTLRYLMDRFDNSETSTFGNKLRVDLPDNRAAEIKKIVEVLGDDVRKGICFEEGVQALSSDNEELVIRNTWQPTQTLIGITGYPEASVAGNVIRPDLTARLSFRLPPTKNAEDAYKAVVDALTEDVPFNVNVSCKKASVGEGWNNKKLSDKLDGIMEKLSVDVFGKEKVSMGLGGSIPFIKKFADAYPEAELIVTGLLGPNSNAHGPNEALNIEYCKKLTILMSHLVKQYFEQ